MPADPVRAPGSQRDTAAAERAGCPRTQSARPAVGVTPRRRSGQDARADPVGTLGGRCDAAAVEWAERHRGVARGALV